MAVSSSSPDDYAMKSLGANAGTAGSLSACAARLIHPPMSRLDGRREVAGCDKRKSEDAPPRQLGAVRRGWWGTMTARERVFSGMTTTS
jgi:hypothetical protein